MTITDENKDTWKLELDEEGRRLALEAEKARLREEIAKAANSVSTARQATLKAMLPTLDDAPTGVVTLGEKAGAFGPWLAHRAVDEAASQIAQQVGFALAGLERSRVLVVEDRALLGDDWIYAEVQQTLRHLDERLGDLKRFLGRTSTRLRRDMADYHTACQPCPPPPQSDAAPVGLERVEREDTSRAVPSEPGGAGPTVSETAAGEGALGAAFNLVGLLRTDYTVSASAVAPSTPELATLTAAHLVCQSSTPALQVEIDGFTTLATPSHTVALFQDATSTRDTAGDSVADLESVLSPLESEVNALKARIEHIEQTWKAAITSEKPDIAARAEVLRAEIDRRTLAVVAGEKALAPAKAALTYARDVLGDTDLVLAGLLRHPENGRSSLLTAAVCERLHQPDDQHDADGGITHVLYVQADAAGGDSVTRRSILGTSGRLGFLGSANASWLLLTTDGGHIVRGGQARTARWMNYDLGSGSASSDVLPKGTRRLPRDPALALEAVAKLLVVSLIMFLFIVGALGVVNLVLSP